NLDVLSGMMQEVLKLECTQHVQTRISNEGNE
ncbi:MAG: hypothetical protein ACI8RD_014713, partial [Bacillariaceae sp.]